MQVLEGEKARSVRSTPDRQRTSAKARSCNRAPWRAAVRRRSMGYRDLESQEVRPNRLQRVPKRPDRRNSPQTQPRSEASLLQKNMCAEQSDPTASQAAIRSGFTDLECYNFRRTGRLQLRQKTLIFGFRFESWAAHFVSRRGSIFHCGSYASSFLFPCSVAYSQLIEGEMGRRPKAAVLSTRVRMERS